jgi:hypothetical protein
MAIYWKIAHQIPTKIAIKTIFQADYSINYLIYVYEVFENENVPDAFGNSFS